MKYIIIALVLMGCSTKGNFMPHAGTVCKEGISYSCGAHLSKCSDGLEYWCQTNVVEVP